MERSSCSKLITILLLCHSLKRSSCQTTYVYMGCYKQFHSTTKEPMAVQSASSCMDACFGRVLHFIGIKYGMACFCGNITYSRVSTASCDLPCATGNHLCGGMDLYSVYSESQYCQKNTDKPDELLTLSCLESDVPVYMGCTTDPLKGMCARICSDRGLLLHVSPTRQCMCATLDYEEQVVNLTEGCQHECLVESKCELVQIFSANFFPGLNKHYSTVFHCANEVTSPTGECVVQSCKPGWKGSRCEHRDCSVNNGDCGDYPCSTYTIATHSIADCDCKKGLTLGLTTFESCTDVDECESNPCMETRELCVNTEKSFMCVCADKHEPIKCDREPCSKYLFSCNGTKCQKFRGFYKCHAQKTKPLKSTDKPTEAKFAADFDVRTIELVVYILVGAVACVLTLMLTRKIRNRHAGKAQFGPQESISSGVGGNVLQKGIHVEHEVE